MKKFFVKVETCNEYEIEIDDETLGDDFLTNFHRYFAEFESWQEHAKYIGTKTAQGQSFIEGYGVPMMNGKKQPFTDEGSMNKHINIDVLTENDIEVDCYEI